MNYCSLITKNTDELFGGTTMSNFVTNRAEAMLRDANNRSDSEVRSRKPRTPQNVWIPSVLEHCKEGIYTKNNSEMIILTWQPLEGGRAIETGIILDKPPFMEDAILDVMLPNAQDNYKFADLVGKAAAIKIVINGSYTNLTDITPLTTEEEIVFKDLQKTKAKKRNQQKQEINTFEDELVAEENEEGNVPEKPVQRGFGTHRSSRRRTGNKQVQSQHSSEDEDDLYEFETEEDELDLDTDLELGIEDDEEDELEID